VNIRAKYPLPHAGAIIPAGATADLPENLARMLIARGQAEDAAASMPAIASATAGAPNIATAAKAATPAPGRVPIPSGPASAPPAPVSGTPRADASEILAKKA
jgi:hypothetical protein